MKGLTFTLANLQKVFDGTKTMTRRMHKKPRFTVGDKFCIREPLIRMGVSGLHRDGAYYDLDKAPVVTDRCTFTVPWDWQRAFLPAMFMPDCAARRFAIITSVKQEPLRNISIEDIIAEGFSPQSSLVTYGMPEFGGDAYQWWIELWDSIYANKPGCAWADNPSPFAYGWKMC